MEILLGIATLLGGVAAAWHFWEKWTAHNGGVGAASVSAAQAAPRKLSGIAVVMHAELRAFGVLMGEDMELARRAVARGRQVLLATIEEFGDRIGPAPADDPCR